MPLFDANNEDLTPFTLPESTLLQLFELTGGVDSHKGIILAYVNEEGAPVIFSKTANQIVEMGLHRALEQFVSEAKVGSGIEFPPSSEE